MTTTRNNGRTAWGFGLALVMAGGVASANPILSNLPGTPATGSNLGTGVDGVDRTKGVGLTMGAESLDFVSMVALMSNSGATVDLSGGIYSSSGGNPGTLLALFTPVSVPGGTSFQQSQEFTLTVAGGFTLQANTSYWFLLDGPSFSNSLQWSSLSPNTAPTADGVTFDGYRFSSNGGLSWSNSGIFNGMTINAIPTPGGAAALGLLGLAAGVRRRR